MVYTPANCCFINLASKLSKFTKASHIENHLFYPLNKEFGPECDNQTPVNYYTHPLGLCLTYNFFLHSFADGYNMTFVPDVCCVMRSLIGVLSSQNSKVQLQLVICTRQRQFFQSRSAGKMQRFFYSATDNRSLDEF